MLQKVRKVIQQLFIIDKENMDENKKSTNDPEPIDVSFEELVEIAKEDRSSTVNQVAATIDQVEAVSKNDMETPILIEEEQEVNLSKYIDNLVQERIGELEKTEKEVDVTEKIVGEEVSKVGVTVSNEKVRDDPYSGYLRPNGQSKRRKMKKKKSPFEDIESMNFVTDAPVKEYNGVVVSYSEKTMPPDMRKYVTHIEKKLTRY